MSPVALPEHREDERVDAHHHERVEQRPEQPERRALEADAELAADERAEQLAVARQPAEAGAAPRLARTLTAIRAGYSAPVSANRRSTSARSPARAPGSGTTSAGMVAGLAGGGRRRARARRLRAVRAARAGAGSGRRSTGCRRAAAAADAARARWRTAWSRLGRRTGRARRRAARRLPLLGLDVPAAARRRCARRRSTTSSRCATRSGSSPTTLRMHGAKYEHAARTCDRIFVNSRFTGGEVVELLGVPEERVGSRIPGIDPRFRPEGEARRPGRARTCSRSRRWSRARTCRRSWRRSRSCGGGARS